MSFEVPTVTIAGKTYAVVPLAYLTRLGDAALGLDTTDAATEKRRCIGDRLRRAREQAGLTQTALAERLGKSQAAVSLAEGGRMRVGQRYLCAVLEACGKPKRATRKGRRA